MPLYSQSDSHQPQQFYVDQRLNLSLNINFAPQP